MRWRNKLTGGLVQQPEYSSLELRNATDKAFLGSEFVAMLVAVLTIAGQSVAA